MILQNQNILKRFGGVVIVWIKKITTSLYVSIFMRMAISAALSVMLLTILFQMTDIYVTNINSQQLKSQEIEMNKFISEIQNSIDELNLTFDEARELDFDQDTEYEIEWLDIELDVSDNHREYDDSYLANYQYVYRVTFGEGERDVFLIVFSDNLEMTANLFNIIASVICIFFFFALSIYLVFKKLSYIKVIDKGIDLIANEDILYKIPIKGRNELARLADNINRMGDTLYIKNKKEREDEASRRFLITNISHDLKTPLTSMTGYVDIISKKLSPEDELYKLASIAKENGNRLEKLMEDLFFYSKLISNDIPTYFQSVNVSILLKQILEIRVENIVYDEKNENLRANIDTEQFHRVIDNLISNGEKYGVKDRPITISSELQNGDVVVTIKNHTEEELEGKMGLLKNRLYTANEDRANGSSGLGLSIASELLKMMNGTLELSYCDKIFTATVKIPKE